MPTIKARSSKARSSKSSSRSSSRKEVADCKNKYCSKFVDRIDKLNTDNMNKLRDHILKKATSSKQRAMIRYNMKKNIKKMTTKKMRKINLEQCMSVFCNTKGCKGTILEDGKAYPSAVKARIIKLVKNKTAQKHLLASSKNIRKTLFKNKKSVLKGNFYEKLSPKMINNLKKKKAISGCATRGFL